MRGEVGTRTSLRKLARRDLEKPRCDYEWMIWPNSTNWGATTMDRPKSTQRADTGSNGTDSNELLRLELAFTFSQNILDRRFALEAWLDGRGNWLLSVDSILIGAVFVFSGNAVLDTAGRFATLASLVSLLTGMAFTLYLALPKFRSRKQLKHEGGFNDKNPRSTFGIGQYGSDEYRQRLTGISIHDMIDLTADQIRQVNEILLQEVKFNIFAIIATSVGLIFGAIAVFNALT
jgi:hypothetical protein